jgi:hypothetical protein
MIAEMAITFYQFESNPAEGLLQLLLCDFLPQVFP